MVVVYFFYIHWTRDELCFKECMFQDEETREDERWKEKRQLILLNRVLLLKSSELRMIKTTSY